MLFHPIDPKQDLCFATTNLHGCACEVFFDIAWKDQALEVFGDNVEGVTVQLIGKLSQYNAECQLLRPLKIYFLHNPHPLGTKAKPKIVCM